MRHRLKLLRLLFFSSLLLCLWLGRGFTTARSLAHGVNDSRSGATGATEWLQHGLEHYQNGDVQGAIDHWQTALRLTTDRASSVRGTALKYLVRAEQQIGEVDRAIARLDQLIVDYQQTGNITQVGRMRTEQAQAYSSLGQQRKAIALLCRDLTDQNADSSCSSDSALAIARRQSDATGEVAAVGTLGNVHRLRGEYERALQYLQTALKLATQMQSQSHQFAALNGLGNTYVSLAKRDDRRRYYAQQSADEPMAQALAQTASRYNREAIEFFEASLTIARDQNNAVNELRSLLNLIVPLQRSGKREEAEGRRQSVETITKQPLGNPPSPLPPLPSPPFPPSPNTALQRAQTLLAQLPASREKVYAAIRLSTLTQQVLGQGDWDRDPATHCLATDVPTSAVTLLQQAIAIAQQIGDSQSEAFALGRLGHVYECRQNYEQALTLTQQAQFAAANYDSRYLWEWQTGRILQLQQKTGAAIAAYDLAVKTLQTIRGDLASASRDFQFDFRDTVEPVYRELTALYLEQATKRQTLTQQKNKDLGEVKPEFASAKPIASALETIDRLRLAELQNYLGEDCTLEANATPVTVVDQKTAVFSSIMLGDRVAVVLTLPAPNHQFHSQVQWLPVNTQTLKTTVNQLRRQLETRSDLAKTYEVTSRQMYDWLIAPFAQDLQAARIETLVFIQDGILRSLPMAALYDGKQFLVEQYALASTLSLTLINPSRIDRHSLRVLGFGLTQPSVVEGPTFFPPLSYVKGEIDSIQAALPDSKGLFDEAFNLDRLQQELTQNVYPIVHLATHGKFGMDARDTFLVTGGKREERREERGERGESMSNERSGRNQSFDSQLVPQNYNETLTMNALYQMLRTMRQGTMLELLTLTACETAVGSDREALGIAGISLQAGARSTVASLWQVDDRATAQLITHFYQSLKQGMSRAKALQAAQKSWLQQQPSDRRHPGYWAALILVGSWL
ncbi:CHAT domain-containing protein [Phormidium sp. FACHB-592]|uniref:CHAT domain-containing protein n=1 Tax=Stenomitos frigidus AS-A4 TaxID=2933935 RepID=A0ABV0KIK8_9CYAN|nr:CHAT domain-containing protein [Phormidium sp. FACHB-592]MBD2075717.1 CHAT domain-containing protein [Phormidium sp. FACHB-592]